MNKYIQKITVLSFIAIAVLGLTACQKSNQNDLQDAQQCLNTVANSEAMNCVAKISSDTSENAYKLRCAAVFISQGFNTPSSFASALDQIKNNNNSSCTGGCSGSLAAMSTLNFGTTADDQAAANQAFSECSKSGVKSYSMLASLFKLGTDLAKLAGNTNPDSLKNQITNLPPADVGQLVITTYQTACSDVVNASDSVKKYCAELQTSLNAGSDATAIGTCLKNKLADPNYNIGNCKP